MGSVASSSRLATPRTRRLAATIEQKARATTSCTSAPRITTSLLASASYCICAYVCCSYIKTVLMLCVHFANGAECKLDFWPSQIPHEHERCVARAGRDTCRHVHLRDACATRSSETASDFRPADGRFRLAAPEKQEPPSFRFRKPHKLDPAIRALRTRRMFLLPTLCCYCFSVAAFLMLRTCVCRAAAGANSDRLVCIDLLIRTALCAHYFARFATESVCAASADIKGLKQCTLERGCGFFAS